jgi:hypothetical protein
MSKQGVKYSRQLAINETSSRRQIDQLELFINDRGVDPEINEYKKSLYSFSVAHAVIFDGLSLACNTFLDEKWQDVTGEWHDIIGRRNDKTETHYRLFAPEHIIQEIFTGPYSDKWPEFRNQLLKLAYKNDEKKKLVIDKKHFIIDAPIKVTPWYEKDDMSKIINLSPRRKGKGKGETGKIEREKTGERETGNAKGRIVGFSIEFFKPLFAPLLELNSKKETGKNYFFTPPYFQLKIERLFENYISVIDGIINDAKRQKAGNVLEMQIKKQNTLKILKTVLPEDVRSFYMALLLRDNHRGEYITINDFIDFINGIWPGLIRTNKDGEYILLPRDYNEAIEKINLAIGHLKLLAHNADLDGGQIVPLEIMAGDKFTRATNKQRIKCIKKHTLFSQYKFEELTYFITRPDKAIDLPMMPYNQAEQSENKQDTLF